MTIKKFLLRFNKIIQQKNKNKIKIKNNNKKFKILILIILNNYQNKFNIQINYKFNICFKIKMVKIKLQNLIKI